MQVTLVTGSTIVCKINFAPFGECLSTRLQRVRLVEETFTKKLSLAYVELLSDHGGVTHESDANTQ